MTDEPFKVTDKRGQDKDEKSVEPLASPHETQANEESSMPEASFANFAASLGTSAMIHLGLMQNPHTNQIEKNIEMAKHEIDLLSMLQEKTKNNLSKEEENFLTQMLYELRMHFVKASK